jgi:hypothetical protein
MNKKFLTGLAAALLVGALSAAPALAGPRFWTDKTKTTLLRDVTATPEHQPDAAEFVNNGNVELKTNIGTITCTEIEFGTTVLSNTTSLARLALPFGVAEGDNCSTFTGEVPTYFDTLASGAVGNAANGNVASVTVTEPGGVLTATVNDLKFSQNIPGIGFCTGDLNGITGAITNSEGPFVEEKTPNLNVQFTKAKVAITASGGVGCPKEGELTANFFLETMSTKTDTAWVA